MFTRLGLVRGDEPYDILQQRFMGALPADAVLYNDYHAQVVMLAKDVCRARPRCKACPIEEACPKRGVTDIATEDKEAVTPVGLPG